MTKSNRTRYESRGRAQDADAPMRGVSPLLQRLMDKIAGQRQDRERGSPAKPPAGHRSGSGADSVAPYLEENRNSRPAPLE